MTASGLPDSGIVGIDHVQVAIPAGGDDVARRFYGELLGMREVPKPAALAPFGNRIEFQQA